MTVFVDASALVAMIAKEPEAKIFAEFLDQHTEKLTSALAIWEATRGVEGARGVSFSEARTLVADFVRAARLSIVPICPDDGEAALDAHERYGRGVHPAARLNFGDCVAYACAKRYDAHLFFKGEDFIHTDVKDATLP